MRRTIGKHAKTLILALSLSAVTLIGAISAFAADSPLASNFSGGSGSASDPYLISNVDQLEAFRDSVNSGNTYEGINVALASDLDISSGQWIPIGTANRKSSGLAPGSNSFKGTFDGKGHTVSGLTITPSGTDTDSPDYTIGFFGAVMGGTVKNLTLSNVKIKSTLSEMSGGAVSMLSDGGVVDNVTVTGTVSGKAGIGGVVGRMIANGTISNCTNKATVSEISGTGNIGGIVGAAYYTPADSHMAISGCTNEGSISGSNDIGGIAGLCCAFISNCTNSGNITGSSYAVGGIAGEMKNLGAITGSSNTATITNTSSASPYGTGGIVGWVRYSGAPPAYALSEEIDVTDNTNSGSIKTASSTGAGGIVGILYSSGKVSGNENTAQEITGGQFVAGIVGGIQDQGEATLPSTIKENAIVVNNVSKTKSEDIKGSLTATYAYNNDPSTYQVIDNSAAWVSQIGSEKSGRCATLDYALSNAKSGDTVNLLADTESNGLLESAKAQDITIDLNGHNIGFDSDGAIVADGGTITITGKGDLYSANAKGAIVPGTELLKIADGSQGDFQLKGGTYPTDIKQYVAKGYEMKELASPDEYDNTYTVEAVSPNSGSEPRTPSGTDNPGAATNQPSNQTNNGDSGNRSGSTSTGSSIVHRASVTSNTPVAGTLAQTSDAFGDTAILIGALSLVALMGSAVCFVSYARLVKRE